MQEILSQLNILVVLTGVSVAVVQYLFTNHQTHLKDFITSLVKIDFDKDNKYDSQLEEQWESAVTECRKHTYFINPNNSILVGFLLIISLVFIFLLNIVVSNFVNMDIILFIMCCIFAIVLFIWLIANLLILRLMFKKESTIKAEFDEIEKQHQLVDKVLNNKG
ncbi:DUF2207 domain-containing protein [thiotrophic endosymbiont of Bathymodiolus puteoserpentis (Logatchev)]|uniref:DUF2207 domain-containing protein n=1 Tax=thiotrophic endosymbiont of Bathymodiolus puteoserpentis (Logatchev) TaxID=343240 RepID=UPI0010B7D8E0|nr:DUF2207 domain-containing protein [thiotrophic endosymbiont of Bathymodiolus puteoserpentis (Logatchev)]SSC10462.1 hypothetical protein BPUTEOSOX_1929 [thiotrophic endosymbiont of Bathymodiolus puteoserpentis (Logatchev)]